MGILVTLEEPNRPMREAAASYEPWETERGPVPRLQIVTIRQLPDSPVAPVRLPAIRHDTHRRAAHEERAGRQSALDLQAVFALPGGRTAHPPPHPPTWPPGCGRRHRPAPDRVP